MSRLFFAVPRRFKLVLLALAVVPCVPGVTFLFAGMMCDPLWPAQRPPPSVEAEYQRASARADALYRAGGVALGVGALCGLGVVWTVIRQRDEPEEEEADNG